MITNSKVHVGLPTNFTTMGSEIQLFCGNQINQKSANPVFTAICGENGAWSPDIISGHIKCATNEESNNSELTLHHGLYTNITLCSASPNAYTA